MKKKTKIIIAVVATVIIIAGFIAYKVPEIFYPLGYKDNCIYERPVVSEAKREEVTEVLDALSSMAQANTKDFTIACEESYTIENLVLPESINELDIPESTFEAFGLVNGKRDISYKNGDYVREASAFNYALMDFLNSTKIKENGDGSTEYTLTLCAETCYFKAMYIYKVNPLLSDIPANLFLYGFYEPEPDLTSVIVRDADVLFPGTTLKVILDKDGQITNMSAEIPVKCEARVISGLFSKDTATIEFTKTVSYDFEYSK